MKYGAVRVLRKFEKITKNNIKIKIFFNHQVVYHAEEVQAEVHHKLIQDAQQEEFLQQELGQQEGFVQERGLRTKQGLKTKLLHMQQK